MRPSAVTAALGAVCAITVCGTELPVAEAESVGMSTKRLEQPYGPAIYDFENAVRQAITD